MNTHRAPRPEKMPDPWHFNSESLLRELDRIRGLIWQIPHRQENVLPIGTAIDAIWRLSEQLRFLLMLHAEGQWSFAKKAAELEHAKAHGQAPKSGRSKHRKHISPKTATG